MWLYVDPKAYLKQFSSVISDVSIPFTSSLKAISSLHFIYVIVPGLCLSIEYFSQILCDDIVTSPGLIVKLLVIIAFL